MDFTSQLSNGKRITKIEDIIDMQKGEGHFNVRQVAFHLPPENEQVSSSACTEKSLESSIYKLKCRTSKKKIKKRLKRRKSPLPDVVSWPSDSDITVLRMKKCLTNDALKRNDGNPGDGFHQPDTSSMVNLATLIKQSRTPSKHSINMEEYLLPLTSWEKVDQENKPCDLENDKINNPFNPKHDLKIYNAACSRIENTAIFYSNESAANRTKSKMAKFLRLYFCPCCTCLYRMEKNDKIREEHSIYYAQCT
uniref:Uncharacterized protein n=1 Tax=Bombyx mori TaxID=7091 RepID=A0A8R2R5P2_BOMMO|nr:uncharacterized protein LOC119630870 [Bombyx mori]